MATQHFAGRWAAKEAVLKALGTGWRRGISWRDIEVRNGPGGRPQAFLQGGTQEVAEKIGIRCMLVSISHCRSHATAYAVALDETPSTFAGRHALGCEPSASGSYGQPRGRCAAEVHGSGRSAPGDYWNWQFGDAAFHVSVRPRGVPSAPASTPSRRVSASFVWPAACAAVEVPLRAPSGWSSRRAS